jgi:hypothetical protein
VVVSDICASLEMTRYEIGGLRFHGVMRLAFEDIRSMNELED